MWKKIVNTIKISLLIIISCVFISTPALAGEKTINTSNIPIITPQYTYINSASSLLTISDGTATIKGSVQKTPSGKNISLTCTLQKKSGSTWTNVKSWSDSSTTDPSVYISEKYTVSKGEYRVKTNYSVSGTNGTESGTVYSKTVEYN